MRDSEAIGLAQIEFARSLARKLSAEQLLGYDINRVIGGDTVAPNVERDLERIAEEMIAWGVAFGLTWERRRWEHAIAQGAFQHVSAAYARQQPELNAGGRLAMRVVRLARRARRAWEGRA